MTTEELDFSRYSYQARNMMTKMGYPLNRPTGLQGGKGILVPIGTDMANAPAQGSSKIIPERTGIGYQEQETSIQVPKRYAGIILDPSSPMVTRYESDFGLPDIFSCNMVTIISDEEETSSKDTEMMEASELEQTSDMMQIDVDSDIETALDTDERNVCIAERPIEVDTREEVITEIASEVEGINTTSTTDEMIEINLGMGEKPLPAFISQSLGEEERAAYTSLLAEFKDVFAWTYAEMPGLDPRIAVHWLNIKADAKP